MRKNNFIGAVSTGVCLLMAVPILAAQPPPPDQAIASSVGAEMPLVTKPAEKCLSDLNALYGQMATDGYWLSTYPVGGFEVRGLVVSVNSLAQNGEQQLCGDMLNTTREIYNLYLADLRSTSK